MSYNLWTKDYKTFELRSPEGQVQFSGAKAANRALLGDRVDYDGTRLKLVQRAEHPILAGLIELNSKVKYGYTSHNAPIYLFTPFNEAYPPFIVGCSERDTRRNRLALVKFDTWTETFPRGQLQRLLPPDADEEALFWTHTPLACIKYKGPDPTIHTSLDVGSRQLLPPNTFHIDPHGCRDVDDVFTIYNTPTETRIIITIADVAAVIEPGSPLDLRAAAIGQTFYQEGNPPKSMFPPELSEDQCSLLPSEIPKPGLSLEFPLNDPTAIRWYLSSIKTTRTFTYDSVYADRPISDTLTCMAAALGEPTEDSHKWVEVAMKFYNMEAAKLLKQHGTGLLRSHDRPDQLKLAAYVTVCPELQFLAYRAANYLPASAPVTYHWGLETSLYTHITSPIRRYADLVNQRALKAILANQVPVATPPVADHLNIIAKRAKQHDRDLILLRAVKSSPSGKTTGTVLELRPLADGQVKLVIYNHAWQLLLRLRYQCNTEGLLISKDEKRIHNVHVGDTVNLLYYADMNARSWKKRMVFALD